MGARRASKEDTPMAGRKRGQNDDDVSLEMNEKFADEANDSLLASGIRSVEEIRSPNSAPELVPDEVTDSRIFIAKALFMCITYLAIGPTLIVLNKYIMQNLKFPYPVTLSNLGQIFTCLATLTLVHTNAAGATVSQEAKDAMSEYSGYGSCFLIGLFKALTFSFGNAVYLHLNMGYIQMLKAFSPVLMLFLLVVTRVEGLPSIHVAFSVFVIALFTAATTATESSATLIGLLYMAAAQLTDGLAVVLTQFLLKKKKFSIIESQYFMTPPTIVWLCLFAAVSGEWTRMYQHDADVIMAANPISFLLAASLGLGVNFLTYTVIQATSGTMLKVLGTLRNIIIVVIGAMFFHEHVSMKEGLCYAGTLGGFSSYSFFTMKEKREADARKRAAGDASG
ncbi:putative sugar phosphate/phosphate translocator [Diplonema papillatum]|nr:putative sugar phosphate/phosphate translocator [Diplonema papillatum]